MQKNEAPMTLEKFKTLTKDDKLAFLKTFAKYASINAVVTADYYPDTQTPFNEHIWDRLDLDLQLHILYWLEDLDQAGLKYSFTDEKCICHSGNWSEMAQHMIPRILERLFVPSKNIVLEHGQRQAFLNLLANNPVYANYMKPQGRFCVLVTKLAPYQPAAPAKSYLPILGWGINKINAITLLNDSTTHKAIQAAGETLNSCFILRLIQIMSNYKINSTGFIKAICEAFARMLRNTTAMPVAISIEIQNLLNYLHGFSYGPEAELYAAFVDEIEYHSINYSRSIVDCFDYKAYGISLPGDPVIPTWLPTFNAQQVGAMLATAVVSAAVTSLVLKP